MKNTEQILAEARQAGIDLDMIDSKLKLSYEERVLRHDSALELMRELKKARTYLEDTARAAEPGWSMCSVACSE